MNCRYKRITTIPSLQTRGIQKFILLIIIIGLGTICLIAQNPVAKGFGAHDPVMIKQDSVYYLFTTGNGVSVASSTDRQNWTREKPVFEKSPDWLTQEIIPGYKGNSMWAPDISLVKGTYYLYYSVSAFGKNTSAIGVATNKTLHSGSPDFKWVDHGAVIQSVPNRDNWNAIDPNLIIDDQNQGWLVFGSFWGGIKMVKLAPDLFSVAKPEVWFTVARQLRTFKLEDSDPGDGTIEGPFIIKRGQYYYLFVSLDHCCRGLKSDYNVVVGRSPKIEGSYIDKTGEKLNNGGGTLIASGNDDWAAVGHNGICFDNGICYFVCHGYDKHDNGRSKLIVRELKWDKEDWPVIKLSY